MSTLSVSHRRASAPAAPKTRVIIDVDELAVERQRRRSMKGRVSILFKSFRRHSLLLKDASSSDHTGKTWDIEEDSGSLDQDPFDDIFHTSSSSSLSSMSEADMESQSELDTSMVLMGEPTHDQVLNHSQFVNRLLAATLLRAVLCKHQPRRKKRVTFVDQAEAEEAEEVPHIPFQAPRSVPRELKMEIVLFRRPLRVEPRRQSQAQELLKEIARYPGVTARELKPQPAELRQEIGRFQKATLRKSAVSVPAQKEERPQADTTKTEDATHTELNALKQKCSDLSKITELLGKQLVESTLTKKRDSKLLRKEAKHFQETLRKLEEQHRAQCAALLSDKKYLEGQLRYTKVESVPPIVPVRSSDQKKHNVVKRRSFLDDLKAPVEACWKSRTSPGMSTRTSFSMAGTMILQNKLMPALLSAVAGANSEQ